MTTLWLQSYTQIDHNLYNECAANNHNTTGIILFDL